jgi:hypothetical protein
MRRLQGASVALLTASTAAAALNALVAPAAVGCVPGRPVGAMPQHTRRAVARRRVLRTSVSVEQR